MCDSMCVGGGMGACVCVHGECSTYSGEFRLSPSVVRSLEGNRSTHTQSESPTTGDHSTQSTHTTTSV